MSFYDQFPEFILTDPRTKRLHPYKVTKDFIEQRHNCYFNFSLKDKTILDLGCCVGSLGAWVLSNGAKFYQGVECIDDFVELSKSNMGKYFSQDQWSIQNTTVEDYLDNCKEHFDIVVLSGLIYAFFDPIPILEKLSKIADTVIIESRYPRTELNDPKYENIPFILFDQKQRMLVGTSESDVEYYSSMPSVGFLKYYFHILGFVHDSEVYDTLKLKIPDYFNYNNRFALKFVKTGSKVLPVGFYPSLITNPDLIKWKM
jgi:SAM-dependent methyltransferase